MGEEIEKTPKIPDEMKEKIYEDAKGIALDFWNHVKDTEMDVVTAVANLSTFDLNYVEDFDYQGDFTDLKPIPLLIESPFKNDPLTNSVGGWMMHSQGTDGCFGYVLYEYTVTNSDHSTFKRYLAIGHLVYAWSDGDKFFVKWYKEDYLMDKSETERQALILKDMDKEGRTHGSTFTQGELNVTLQNSSEKSPLNKKHEKFFVYLKNKEN